MSVTDHAFLALDTLQKIGGHFGTELREDDPERAARRRELETEISSALPLLDVVSADLRVVLARGATLDVTQLHVLRTICRKFSAIYDHTLG
ncbi:MAG TPA: hypothetical protein VF590_02800, partial [Isosphaeraceae bacterium]